MFSIKFEEPFIQLFYNKTGIARSRKLYLNWFTFDITKVSDTIWDEKVITMHCNKKTLYHYRFRT